MFTSPSPPYFLSLKFLHRSRSVMAALAFAALMLAMIGGSEAAWCICKQDMSDTVLQKTLDYACGAGADCNPILQNGACYNPNTVRSHCSYAANSYYQRKGQTQQACDFAGTAMLTSTDPSYSSCVYPATTSAAGSSSTPATSTAGTPSSFTPSSSGLGPSTDTSHSGFHIKAGVTFLPVIIFTVLCWAE